MLCDVCHENRHKYNCPRCACKTCSLSCVKQHKQDKRCNGQRDKTKFVSVSDFNDSSLLNDYRLLEDTDRKAYAASRDRIRKQAVLPPFLKRLSYQARKRGIRLQTLPYPMTKRKVNLTRFNFITHMIEWYSEWVFPEVEAKYKHKFDENISLRKALLYFIHPSKASPIIRHKLRNYVAMVKQRIDQLDCSKQETHINSEDKQAKSGISIVPSAPEMKDETVKDKLPNTTNESSVAQEQPCDSCICEKAAPVASSHSERETAENWTLTEIASSINVTSMQKLATDLCENEIGGEGIGNSSATDKHESGNVVVDKEDGELSEAEVDMESSEEIGTNTADCNERYVDCVVDTNIEKEETSDHKCGMNRKKEKKSLVAADSDNDECEVDDELGVFMKIENSPANKIRYYRLSLLDDFTANLKGRLVVEFPTFYVVQRKSWDKFPLCDTD